VDVVVSEAARAFAREHGGELYVRVRRSACCSGTMTTLAVATQPPRAARLAETLRVGDLAVHLFGSPGRPAEMSIDLRGRVRPHLVAYWDGCAYRL